VIIEPIFQAVFAVAFDRIGGHRDRGDVSSPLPFPSTDYRG